MSECNETWKPTASIKSLQARAVLYQQIRAFFQAQQVMEVEVPLLSQSAVTDPQLDVIEAHCCGRSAYLQTSPEFGLKRLLAAGVGSCYSLGKAFRNDEAGSRHNPEFSMLEWYRVGFDDHQLMAEVDALIRSFLPATLTEQNTVFRSYRKVFLDRLGIDPHLASSAELQQVALDNIAADLSSFVSTESSTTEVDTWLDLLMTHCIEPTLQGIHFIYDYPATQAALARCMPNNEGVLVARRFELYIQGMELANGYWELCDAELLAQRFAQDQSLRSSMELPRRPIDENLLAAHRAGLPDCAGVAMGLDRLLMLLQHVQRIDEVIVFPFPRA